MGPEEDQELSGKAASPKPTKKPPARKSGYPGDVEGVWKEMAAIQERQLEATRKELDANVGKFSTMPEAQRVRLAVKVMLMEKSMGYAPDTGLPDKPVSLTDSLKIQLPRQLDGRHDREYKALQALSTYLVGGPDGIPAKEYDAVVTKLWTEAKQAAAQKVEERQRLLESIGMGKKKR